MNDDNVEILTIRKDSNLRFDRNLGNYTLTNKRVFHDAIIISVPSFLKLESELFKMFGSSAPTILQIVGEAAGGESAKRITNVDDIKEDIKTVFNGVSKWGFGRYELVDFKFEDGYIKFKLYNNPLIFHGMKPISHEQPEIKNHHFLIGFYNGYFGMLFNKMIVCNETACMNRGETFCEFEIKTLGG